MRGNLHRDHKILPVAGFVFSKIKVEKNKHILYYIFMNAREFIYKVIKLYHSARLPKFANDKIKRGRSHSISSNLEDLFALFLVGKIRCEKIYVDQPISVSGIKNTNYPDISVVRNEKITSFCDVKSSLGWGRGEFFSLLQTHNNWIKHARGRNCKLKDGITKEVIPYTISKTATYNVVMLTDTNINAELLNQQIVRAKVFLPSVEVFVLTSGAGLNEYGIGIQSLLRKLDIKTRVFEKLIRKLNR